jgi:hypothetical protein
LDPTRIFGPVLALMVLTMVVWIYMYARRIPFIRSLDRKLDDISHAEFTELAPPAVRNPSDNLRNLFEVPVLFYALVLYLYVTARVDDAYLAAAWGFVAFRVLHSAVHCTVNIVLLRFTLYVISCLFLFYMLVRAVVGYIG